MANISKINQKLTQFGPAPQRTDPANFPTRANAMVAHFLTHLDEQNIMSEQYNTSIDELNTTITDMNNKHQEIVEKHTDFIPKYDDLADKYDKFIPKYNDTVKKHGEVVSHSNHVDSVKAQIDIDLERAKSFINEQNNVINDTKISEVSTLSSKRLKELIDLKADEATAYKDWNYKTISSTYTAQDNDALFVEATAPFEITLPAKGKVRIIDKAGNFATYNIKLIAGSDKFVLNKDFQRVELFFFNGKWQITSGYLLEKDELVSLVGGVSQAGNSTTYTRVIKKDDKLLLLYPISGSTSGTSFIDIETGAVFTRANPQPTFNFTNNFSFLPQGGCILGFMGKSSNQAMFQVFRLNFETFSWEQAYQKTFPVENQSFNFSLDTHPQRDFKNIEPCFDNKTLILFKDTSSKQIKKQVLVSDTNAEEVNILPNDARTGTIKRLFNNLVMVVVGYELKIINLDTKQVVKTQSGFYYDNGYWDDCMGDDVYYFRAENNDNKCYKYNILQNTLIKIQRSEFDTEKNKLYQQESPATLVLSDKQKIVFETSQNCKLSTTINGIESVETQQGSNFTGYKPKLIVISNNYIFAKNLSYIVKIPIKKINKTKEI